MSEIDLSEILLKYARKTRELAILALGIKRDGHKEYFANQEIRELRDSRIRRDDCITVKKK